MLSSQLKIARDIKDLLWMVLEMRKNMPKHLAFSIADRMQETLDRMFSCVSYANRFKDRRAYYLDTLLAEFCKLELYVEMCVEHRMVQGTKHLARLLSLTAEIGRQATGWRKSVQ